MINNIGLPVKPNHYIYPPRARDVIPLSEAKLFAKLGWIGQLKYNDSRCLIKYQPNHHVELWNRHQKLMQSFIAPDYLIDQLMAVKDKIGSDEWMLLDGGLLHNKHTAIKNTVVIWDVLVLNGRHLLGSTYGDRYNFLKERLCNQAPIWQYKNPVHGPVDFGLRVSDNILMPINYVGNRNDTDVQGDAWQSIWDTIITTVNAPYTVGKPNDKNYDCKPVIEGLVFKSLDEKLEMGLKEKNNSSWMCRSRVATGRHNF